MPNYTRKGVEHMRKLGRAGGKKSGVVRRKHAVQRAIFDIVHVWEICEKQFTLAETEENLARGLPDCSGGSHDTDWRCPGCHQFHSAKTFFCRKCGRLTTKRVATRKRIRERQAEHRIAATLRKFDLQADITPNSSDDTMAGQWEPDLL